MGIIVLLACLLVASPALASPCEPMRLDQPGGPLEHIPVLDQDGSNMCYAFVASQLVDAYRFSHGDSNDQHLTSPLAAAVFAAADDPEQTDIEVGLSKETIEAITRYGSCNYNVVFGKRGKDALKEYFQQLRKYFEDSTPSPARRELADEIASYINEHGPPSKIIRNTDAVLSALAQPTYKGYLEKLFRAGRVSPACSERSRMANPTCNFFQLRALGFRGWVEC